MLKMSMVACEAKYMGWKSVRRSALGGRAIDFLMVWVGCGKCIGWGRTLKILMVWTGVQSAQDGGGH